MTLFRRELSSNNDYRDFKPRRVWSYYDVGVSDQRLGYYSGKLARIMDDSPHNNIFRTIFILVEMLRKISTNNLSAKTLSNKISLKKSNKNTMVLLPFHVDQLFSIVRYLQYSDTTALLQTCCSYSFQNDLSNDFIWKQLWKQKFGSMWMNPRIQSIRMLKGGSMNCEIDEIDNFENSRNWLGWRRFLIEFDHCWLPWLISGCNTFSLCLIGIDNGIFDLTSFLDIHPGSLETLLNYAGADVTTLFNDIGHSSYATNLKEDFLVFPKIPIAAPTIRSEKMDQEEKIVRNYFDSCREIRVSSDVEIFRGHTVCLPTTAHYGQAQVFFDPIRREWIGWYSCCGLGRIFDIDESSNVK